MELLLMKSVVLFVVAWKKRAFTRWWDSFHQVSDLELTDEFMEEVGA